MIKLDNTTELNATVSLQTKLHNMQYVTVLDVIVPINDYSEQQLVDLLKNVTVIADNNTVHYVSKIMTIKHTDSFYHVYMFHKGYEVRNSDTDLIARIEELERNTNALIGETNL